MKYKILLIFAGIYIIILGVLLYINEINKTEVLIYPNVLLKYDGKNWQRKNYKNSDTYKIFLDNHYLYDSKVIVNDNTITINNEIVYDYIGLSNNKIKIIDFKKEEMTNEEINKILDILNINSNNFVTVSNKISIDIDNDKKMETIYFISNSFKERKSDILFSAIYVEDEENYVVTNQSYFNESKTKACDIANIIDVNNDNKYELLVRCPGFSESGITIQIFEIKNNRLVLTNEV